MTHVQELISLCGRLERGTITDRRKAAASLTDLIANPDACSDLDELGRPNTNSSGQAIGGRFTWDSVFTSVVGFVKTEAESLTKAAAKGGASASSDASRSKKAREAADALRLVARHSEKHAHFLDASSVVAQILDVVRDEEYYRFLGVDFVNILANELLTRRHFWINMTPIEWRNLVVAVRVLLSEQRVTIVGRGSEREALSRCLYQLLRLASMQTCIKTKKKNTLSFFEKFFAAADVHSESAVVVVNIVKSVNVYCETLKEDEPMQIAALGEAIIPVLVNLGRRKKSELLKLETLKFLRFQFDLHEEIDAVGDERWRRCVLDVFQVLFDQIFEKQKENKVTGTSGRKSLLLPPAFVSFAARVFRIVLGSTGVGAENSFVVAASVRAKLDTIGLAGLQGNDVNDATAGSDDRIFADSPSSPASPTPAAKRRRLEIPSPWPKFTEQLAALKTSAEAAPWAQLVAALLLGDFGTFDLAEMRDLLETLVETLSSKGDKGESGGSKVVHSVVAGQTLSCLREVALAWRRLQRVVDEHSAVLWRPAWNLCWRLCHDKDLETSALEVLSAIVSGRLLGEGSRHLDFERWKSFSPSCLPVSTASVVFLLSCLAHDGLPHTDVSAAADNAVQIHSLRTSIIRWLLDAGDSEAGLDSSGDVSFNATMASTIANATFATQGSTQAAKTLAILSKLKCRWLPRGRDRSSGRSGADTPAVAPVILAAALVSLSFHDPVGLCIWATRNNNEDGYWAKTASIIDAVWKEVEDSLSKDVDSLRDKILSVPEMTSLVAPHVLSSVFLQATLVKTIYKFRVFVDPKTTFDPDGALAAPLRRLLQEAAPILHDFATSFAEGNRKSAEKAEPILRSLIELYDAREEGVAQFLAAVIPDSITTACRRFVESTPDSAASSSKPKPASGGGCEDDDLWVAETDKANAFADPTNLRCHADERRLDVFARSSSAAFELLVKHEELERRIGLTSRDSFSRRFFEPGFFDPSRSLSVVALKSTLSSSVDADLIFDVDLVGSLLKAVGGVFKLSLLDQTMYTACIAFVHHLIGVIDRLSGKVLPSNDVNAINEENHADSASPTVLVVKYREAAKKLLLHVRSDRHAFPVADQSFKLRASVAACYVEFSRVDPGSRWGADESGIVEAFDVVERICEVLVEKSHKARLVAARGLSKLFFTFGDSSSRCNQSDYVDAFSIWQKVTSCAETLLESLPDGDDLSDADERKNLATTLTTALISVVESSEIVRLDALLLLARKLRAKGEGAVLCGDDRAMLERIASRKLNEVASRAGAKDLKDYVRPKIRHLLHRWINAGISPLEFPFRLAGHSSLAQMVESHEEQIVSSFVYNVDLTKVKEVAQTLKRDPISIVLAALPMTTVLIIMDLISVEDKIRGDAEKKMESIIDMVSMDEFRERLRQASDRVLVMLIQRLDLGPDAAPPSADRVISCSSLKRCVSLFGRQVGFEIKSSNPFIDVLVDPGRPCVVGLFSLYATKLLNSDAGTTAAERRRLVAEYNFLSSSVFDGEQNKELSSYLPFLIGETCSTLCHFLDTEIRLSRFDEAVVRTVLETLRLIVDAASRSFPHFIGVLLPLVMGTLSRLIVAVESSDLISQCRDLLKLLTVDNVTILYPYVRGLYLLPRDSVFAETLNLQISVRGGENLGLQEEIRLFLNSYDSVSSTELLGAGLDYLQTRFSEHSSQLHFMNELRESGLITLLLSTLFQIFKRGGPTIGRRVMKLLGSIGPAPFEKISLPKIPDFKWWPQAERLVDDLFGKTMRDLTVLKMLDDRIDAANMNVRRAARKALLRVFRSVPDVEDLLEQLKEREAQFVSEEDQRLTFSLSERFFPFLRLARLEDGDRENRSFNGESVAALGEERFMRFADADNQDFVTVLCKSLLSSGLVREAIVSSCDELLDVDYDFAFPFLPLVVESALSGGEVDSSARTLLSDRIREFFESVPSESGTLTRNERRATEALLGVVAYLRLRQRPRVARSRSSPPPFTDWANEFWLELDHLCVSKAALACGQPFAAVMYLELWVKQRRKNDGVDENSQTKKDILKTNSGYSGSVSSHLSAVYAALGESDCIYGCGSELVANPKDAVSLYIFEKKWDSAASSANCLPPHDAAAPLAKSLVNLNLPNVAFDFLSRAANSSRLCAEESEIFYESAIKLSKWNLDIVRSQSSKGASSKAPPFYQCIYNCLSGIKIGNLRAVEEFEGVAIQSLLEDVKASSHSIHSVNPILTKAKTFMDICELRRLAIDPTTTPLEWRSLATAWKADCDSLRRQDFSVADKIIAVRLACSDAVERIVESSFSDSRENFSNSWRREKLKLVFDLCKISRDQGWHHASKGAFARLGQMLEEDQGASLVPYWELEEPSLYWEMGEEEKAKFLLRRVIEGETKSQSTRLVVPLALNTMGAWLSESNMASSTTINDDYLQRSVDMLKQTSALYESKSDKEILSRIHLTVAKFADAEYQSIKDYMESSLYAEKRQIMSEQEAELEGLIPLRGSLGKDDQKYLTIMKRTRDQDAKADDRMIKRRREFLAKALEHFLVALKLNASVSDIDPNIFRVLTLWFDNADLKEITELVLNLGKEIPPHAFLPVVTQMATRLGDAEGSGDAEAAFQNALKRILARVCKVHPHHTMYALFALVNANKEEEKVGNGASGGSAPSNDDRARLRTQSAKLILEHLMMKGLEKEVTQTSRICDAVIEAAYIPVAKQKDRAMKFPSSAKILQLLDLEVPVPIASLPVRTDGRYSCSDFPSLVSFEPEYKIAGGVNVPKIIHCLGSDGKRYKMLVKGNDDLRQDAVMQQVFALVNRILVGNDRALRRRLRMRTYKIIPTTASSGLLEFCQGTMPLGAYLTDENGGGAHARYHPEALHWKECRKKMMEVERKSSEVKLAVFQDICRQFPPVFSHFFWEKFKDPSVWFERRLSYTRSVATGSIVGYVLGLGDRHLTNILVDCQTAELVHIDFGIAFDQGRILPVPETIPFRLTRDILDPMGISGVDGVFTRCAEIVLGAMREGQGAIRSILDVILHDPMSSWTLSPAKRLQIQKDRLEDREEAGVASTTTSRLPIGVSTASGANTLAKRVLSELSQKLSGHVGGARVMGRGLSVEGQVKHLIQEATDPVKLSALFHGWKPFA